MVLREINPLTPNGLYSGRAVSLLNSRTATIVVANSVSNFGGILFTGIQLFTVVCFQLYPWRSGFHTGDKLYPLHLLNPFTYEDIYTSLSKCAFLHDDLLCSDTTCFVYRTFWSSLWAELSKLAYGTKILSWPEWLSVAYCTPYISEKCNAQKSEILTNINVYSYRRVHKRASCSAWVICRGCEVITCKTQPSVY